MCDYSLHHVASRPAKIADRLITTKFRNTVTLGFSAVGEPHVAVCLRPGTELAFEREVEWALPLARLLPWFGFGAIGARTARFRQINVGTPDAHHDALEFPSGRIVLVTKLRTGQRATVLQLPMQTGPDGELEPPISHNPLFDSIATKPEQPIGDKAAIEHQLDF